MKKYQNLQPRLRLFVVIATTALLSLALVTIFLANLSHISLKQSTNTRFNWETEKLTNSVNNHISNYSNLLYMGQSFAVAHSDSDQSHWVRFFESQDIFNRYPGVSSISYIKIVSPEEKNSFIAQQRKNPSFGTDYSITPEGSRDLYALVAMTATISGIQPNGFDLYSDPARKAIYDTAQATGVPAASEQLRLNSGNDGMFLVLPVKQNDLTVGFVTVALHTDDLLEKLLDTNELSPITMKITDTTRPESPTAIVESQNYYDNKNSLTRYDVINFGNRLWRIDYNAPTKAYESAFTLVVPYLILLLGFLLVIIILTSLAILFRTVPAPSENNI